VQIEPRRPADPAAAPSSETLLIRGTASRQFEPSMVRVRWRVYASGKTGTSAYRKLEASRKELEQRFTSMTGSRPRVAFGPAVEQAAQENAGAMQARMIQMAMGQGKEEETDEPKPVRLVMTTTVEWDLKGADPAARFAEIDDIRQQLREIDVLDRPKEDESDTEDTEEEGEAKKESDASSDTGADDEKSSEAPEKPALRIADGPTFYYVHCLSEAEAGAVLKAAVEDARVRGQRLASAAGRELGSIRGFSSGPELPDTFQSQVEQSTRMMESMFGGNRPAFDEDKAAPETEIRSERIGPLSYTANVSVTYQLK
jgi:hypothetical protein